MSDEQNAEIMQALESGQKIQAIKIYREANGVGLKEAKEAVDAMAKDLIQKDPEKYAVLSESSGCAGMFILGLLIPVGVIMGILQFVG